MSIAASETAQQSAFSTSCCFCITCCHSTVSGMQWSHRYEARSYGCLAHRRRVSACYRGGRSESAVLMAGGRVCVERSTASGRADRCMFGLPAQCGGFWQEHHVGACRPAPHATDSGSHGHSPILYTHHGRPGDLLPLHCQAACAQRPHHDALRGTDFLFSASLCDSKLSAQHTYG